MHAKIRFVHFEVASIFHHCLLIRASEISLGRSSTVRSLHARKEIFPTGKKVKQNWNIFLFEIGFFDFFIVKKVHQGGA